MTPPDRLPSPACRSLILRQHHRWSGQPWRRRRNHVEFNDWRSSESSWSAGCNANGLPIVGQTIQWTAGPNTGLTARIVGYNNATGVAAVATPFPAAAAMGDTFIILPIPDVVSPLTLLQGVTVAPGYVAPAVNGGEPSRATSTSPRTQPQLTSVNRFSSPITRPILDSQPLSPSSVRSSASPAAGAFVFNQPFSGNVPAGTTFNIVGTAASAQGVVAGGATATTFGASATPANNFGNGSVAGAALSAVNGFYVGQALTFTNGPRLASHVVITAYNGAGPISLSPNLSPRYLARATTSLIGPSTTPPIQGGVAGARPPSRRSSERRRWCLSSRGRVRSADFRQRRAITSANC